MTSSARYFDGPCRYKRLGTENGGKLGAGAYGTVYCSWDQADQKTVAIKEQFATSDSAEREMLFFHSIPSHPHLLEMRDQFVQGTMLYLVFQYLEASLHDVWTRARGFLDWDKADRYGYHVLLGLAHLHHHKVAHRDLSMGNILFDASSNSVRIADLGLAHCSTSRLLEGKVTTLWFRAPEVLLGVASLSCSQAMFDMWSVGCVLGALWSATIVFEAETEFAVWGKQVSLLGPPEAVWPGVVCMPKWKKFSDSVTPKTLPTGPEPRVNPIMVRRTLTARVQAVAVLRGLLAWDPGLRMSADEVLQDDVLWAGVAGVSLVHVPCGSGNTSPSRALPAVDPLEATPQKEKRRCPLSSPPPSAKRVSGRLPKCDMTPTDSRGSVPEQELVPSTAFKIGPQLGMCACSGNCGITSCNRAKALIYSRKVGKANQSICVRDASSTSSYCICCRCEVADCQRQKTRSRWCGKHAAIIGKNELQPGQYRNASGTWAANPDWSWELKMVALHGWMLAMMCPSDVTAFVQAADDLVGSSEVLSGHCMLQLWACAVLVWPQAVKGWAKAIGRSGMVLSAAEYTAASLLMAQGIDTESQTGMHEEFSTGGSDVILGPVATLSKLGIACKADRHPSLSPLVADPRLDNNDVNDCYGETIAELHLGMQQHLYRVRPESSQWQLLVDLANDFTGLVLPRNRKEATKFVTAVCTFLRQFPERYGHGAQHGSTDNHGPSEGYIRKSIMQKIILWVQSRTPPEVWETMTVNDMCALTPDNCHLLAGLSTRLTCKQITRVFGCPAYMVSWWACLFHGVKQVNRCVFDVSSDALWCRVCTLKEEQGEEPNLDTLAHMVLTKPRIAIPRQARRKFQTTAPSETVCKYVAT
jgi:serine/threonine protein kinase